MAKEREELVTMRVDMDTCAICNTPIEENGAFLDAANLAPYTHLTSSEHGETPTGDNDHEAIPSRFYLPIVREHCNDPFCEV